MSGLWLLLRSAAAVWVLIGLVIGIPLGAILMGHVVRLLFLAGRITTREIAEQCDRLIDAADEPTEPTRPPRGPRTL